MSATDVCLIPHFLPFNIIILITKYQEKTLQISKASPLYILQVQYLIMHMHFNDVVTKKRSVAT